MSAGFQWPKSFCHKGTCDRRCSLNSSFSVFFQEKNADWKVSWAKVNLCFVGLIYDIFTAITGMSSRCQKALDSCIYLVFFLFAFTIKVWRLDWTVHPSCKTRTNSHKAQQLTIICLADSHILSSQITALKRKSVIYTSSLRAFSKW